MLQQHPARIMKQISRRDMLAQSTRLASTFAVGLPLAANAAQSALAEQPQAPAPRKLKIIVTGGHPGDPEYGCGGTIARYADLGHELVLLYLNKGDWTNKPGYDPAPIR